MQRLAVLATALLALCVPAPAAAVHWAQLGGDGGHSGYQPLGDGTPPVQPLWNAPDAGVVTSPVISQARLDQQHVIYGTVDGRVHLRRLLTGEPVGPADGILVEESLSAGVFGDGEGGGSASFAETSGPEGLGRVLVVHNARNGRPLLGGLDDDVELTAIDETTGAVVQNLAVPGTVDHVVASSAVLTPPNGGGDRQLLFLAGVPGGQVSLFRVAVDAAGRLGATRSVPVGDANPLASPGVAYLTTADGPEPHAVVATATGLVSFAASDLRPGPAAAEPRGLVATPAVPVTASGLTPGQPGSRLRAAPALYVAATDGSQTRVVRLSQDRGDDGGAAGKSPPLEVRATSPALEGVAAPSLALAQEVVAGTPAAGWVAVTTGEDLYALDARTLGVTGRLRGEGAGAAAAGEGFRRTVAASAGSLAFAARDNGDPVVVDLQSMRPFDEPAFTAHAGHVGGLRSVGQPAISRGLVVFASDRGVFAYRTRCGNAVGGTEEPDRLTGSAPGDAIAGRGGEDLLAGGDGDDCLDGGTGADELRGDAGADTLAGGTAGDLLNGGAGDDDLRGGPSRDRLSGGPGADRLAGGTGPDTLSAGAGDDRLNARGGGRDRLLCGAGSDTVLADRRDRIAADCERVTRR